MKKGKFIVIEGTDGSGKATQLNLLYKRLRKIISKILLIDFPRYYVSVWGEMVGEFLVGKYGKFEEVDPHLMVLPYMIDQYTWSRDTGKPWIEKGGIILADRYFTSNVHQIAKLKTRAKKQYRDWLWPAGYNDLRIMRPDLVVFLDVPPDRDVILLPNKISCNVRGGIDILGKLEKDQFRAFVFYRDVVLDTLGNVIPHIEHPVNTTLKYIKPERLRYIIKKFR